MANSAFGLPSAYDPSIIADQQSIDRQQALATLLRGQGMTPLDPNRQIGGMAYKISPFESLAKLAQTYAGAVIGNQADTARQALATKQAEAMAQMLRDVWGDKQTATPTASLPAGVTPQAMEAGGFPQPAPQAAPTIDPMSDRRKRIAQAALLRGDKDLVDKLIMDEVGQTPEMKNYAAEGIDPRAMGSAKLAKAKADALLKMSAGDTIYDPATKMAQFTAPDRPAPDVKALGEALPLAGIAPDSPEGRKMYADLVRKQTNFAPANTVNVSTGRTYGENLAEGFAKADTAAVEAGRNAPDKVSGAMRIKALLEKNPITGTAAEGRLGFEKALATAGFKSGDRAVTTENLVTEMAGSTLDNVKASGLGAGAGFSNNDLKFLEKAKSGNLEMTSGNIKYLADLNERAARASIGKANDTIRRLNKNPDNKVFGLEEIQLPAGPVKVAPTAPVAGGLSPTEQAELEALRKRFGK